MRALVIILLTSSIAIPATARTNPCLTDVDSVAKFRSIAQIPYYGRDSAATVAAGYPWARYENIQIVTDSTACAAGVAAFNDLSKTRNISAAYVFALGGTGYGIMLPDDAAPGGQRPLYVFTTAWVHKISYLT